MPLRAHYKRGQRLLALPRIPSESFPASSEVPLHAFGLKSGDSHRQGQRPWRCGTERTQELIACMRARREALTVPACHREERGGSGRRSLRSLPMGSRLIPRAMEPSLPLPRIIESCTQSGLRVRKPVLGPLEQDMSTRAHPVDDAPTLTDCASAQFPAFRRSTVREYGPNVCWNGGPGPGQAMRESGRLSSARRSSSRR